MFSFFRKKKLFQQPLTPSLDAFLGQCTQEYNEKLAWLQREWGFAHYRSWGFDQTTGAFHLLLHDGSRVEAKGQCIGSFMPANMSWEWAWNNPHVEAAVKRDSLMVRAWGKKAGLGYLLEGILSAPDHLFPAYLSSIALKVTGSDGVFAETMGGIQYFLTLKNLRRR